MKGILYYFSGTGNTKWASDKLKKGLMNYGIDLDIKSIEREKFNLRGYCFLVIGTPIYAELEPKLVEDFVQSIPATEVSVKCILFSTQGGNSGSAIKRMSRILKAKGYNVVIESMIKMPNNYYFYAGKEPNNDDIQNILKDAEDKINFISKNFNNNKCEKVNIFALREKIGTVGGKAFRKAMPKVAKSITSTNQCTKCGLCLRNCPKGNITFENGRAVFHSNCILCLRCIYLCPENAVVYKGKRINQIQKEIIKNLELK
ncbi:MAG: EFR1 family ferrodoxin [Solirubrobacterales bacterium]